MALCLLLKLHREQEGWPKQLLALTVDHGVRPESREEASKVQERLSAMGIFFNLHAYIEASFIGSRNCILVFTSSTNCSLKRTSLAASNN